MSRLTQKGQGAPLPLFSTSTDTSLITLTGARFDSSDGREFVLVGVGGATVAQGLLVQNPAIIANHQNLAVATAAVGATTITATSGGTAVTANQYRNGYLVVNAGTGIGQTLKVSSNGTATATGVATITLEDPVLVALDSTSKVDLIADPYYNVIVNPTTPTGTPIGVTAYQLASGNYGLLQTKGIVSLTSEALIATVGLGVAASAATAGYGRSATAAGAPALGIALQSAVSAEARAIWLNL